ncbi:metallophosphoesterase [Sphingomonas lutea]|uniref:Metallophosphoesterase n=1 Tax=Sphingomonas lutea TaxID=1045317 RepID=A0A7G9SKG3_9SPHN|nr:metallophosphoesterase [Sphingomonas lutea]QNN68338.1 metallophosphoesterase [Sphingomonas lutea]
MVYRIVRVIIALFCALALGAVPAAAQRQAPARIVAIGDLHGDYAAWAAIAQAAKLTDSAGKWIGGTATLVQLGDFTDRGPDSLRIIRNLQQLQRESMTAGGRVVIVLGNHEAMNVFGDLRYTTPGEFAAFRDARSQARRERVYIANRRQIEAAARKDNPSMSPSAIRDEWLEKTPLGWVEHRAAWAPSGTIGRWATSNPAVVKIGETLFVHGGLSSQYAALGIDEVNRRVAAAMARAEAAPTSVLSDALGPLWYRGLVTRDPRVDGDAARALAGKPRLSQDDELTAVLAATGTKRMVVGHTPSLRGVIVSANGRLIRADTGNARHYGGQLAYVEIVGERVTTHNVARSGAPAQAGR